MGSVSSQLRLSVPVVDTPDHVAEQLAEAARNSRVSSARRGRLGMAVAAAAGVVLLSVGGAWATGAVTLPGLPEINVRTPQEPRPTAPEAPQPSPTPVVISPTEPPVDQGTPPVSGAGTRGDGVTPSQEDKEGGAGKKEKPAKQSDPGQGRGAPEQQKDPGRSQSPGRSEQTPKSPGRSEQAPKGPEKRDTPERSAQGPDTATDTSRSQQLGSSDKESPGRG